MNQQQQLELLNNIMPDIADSGDAHAVLLKTAKAKNLAPAQLEKLAQCFNSCKTIVGLKKMANRGDSFSIVDVPTLVNEYTAYKPKKEATIEKKASKSDMDDWTAAIAAMNKEASANFHLPPGDADVIRFTNDDWKPVLDSGSPLGMDIFDNLFEPAKEEQVIKVASAFKELDAMSPAERYAWGKQVRALQEDVEQFQYEINEELNKQASIIIEAIKPNYRERWHEVAEDAFIAMDKKASATAVKFVEERFRELHKVYSPAPDLEKAASTLRDTRCLARDRYGVLENMEAIASLADMREKVASFRVDVGDILRDRIKDVHDDLRKSLASKLLSAPAKKESNSYKQSLVHKSFDIAKRFVGKGTTHSIASAAADMVRPDKKKLEERKKDIDKNKQEAEYRSTMDTIKLENPVIAAADPSSVERIMKTLRVLCPTLSKSPDTLAPIVAASIEAGGSIPIPMMTSISEIEKNLADMNDKRTRVDSRIIDEL